MEQRLIDANALWELMRTYDDYQGAKEAHDLELIHRDSILFAIETAPTVDAVPVVRCKDCKHYKDGFCYNPNTYDDEKTCGNTAKDWFCADGKRRTDE